MEKFSSVHSNRTKLGGEAIASASVLKLVRIVQRIGKKMASPMIQATAVVVALRAGVTLRAMSLPPSPQASRFLPIIRIRKIATMLARMMAMIPPAAPPPTSKCRSDWA